MIKQISTAATTGVLLAVAIIAAACGPGTRPATGGSVPSDWPAANHDLSNTRVATGSPISSANVHRLGVDWSFKMAGSGPYGLLSTSPIVVNQTVYIQDLDNNVYAIDLNRGALRWQKKYRDTALGAGPNGVAYENGKVFAASDLHTAVALDANNGAEVWSRQIAPSLQKIEE